MASGFELHRCSICEKNEGKCICNGCKKYFCIKDFNKHREQLSIKFDTEIVSTRDELLEQMNQAKRSNAPRSSLFNDIDRWESETTEKVHQAAERARQQLTQLLNQEKDMVTKDFGIMTEEIRDRKEEETFDENDIERFREKISQIRISLEQFIQPTKTKAIIVTNNEIDWNRLIYVDNEQKRTSKYIDLIKCSQEKLFIQPICYEIKRKL